MTEAEWLACESPGWLICETQTSGFGGRKYNYRGLRLFACACVRRISHLVTDARSWCAVEAAERYAEGPSDVEELNQALEEADFSLHPAVEAAAYSAVWDDHEAAEFAAMYTAIAVDSAAGYVEKGAGYREHGGLQWGPAGAAERAAQLRLLRCILGNPFLHAPISASCLAWNDGAIREMAQAIYNARAFDQTPLLADALEKAGCDNQHILDHCRSAGEHVRGCWVVDLLLGKS